MAAKSPPIQTHSETPFYRDERVLRWAAQIVSAVLLIGFAIWAVINFFAAAEARGMNLTFRFLNAPAGFPISDPAIDYSPSDSFGRAFLVGILNTLRVSVVGIAAATILGTLVALARLSPNWLLSRLALIFIEFHRNIPLLVLLFLWYFSVFTQMPSVQDALRLPGPIFLTQRGVYLAWPRLTETGQIFLISVLVAVVAAAGIFTTLRRRQALTGQVTNFSRWALAAFVGIPALGWFLAGGNPLWLDVPSLAEGASNFRGGLRFTPEFAGLLVGLVMYTAGFIAEVVRAGIQAVDRGQVEAARAVGLSQTQVLSLVVLPQALRVITPPMISQYLNLTKNSSLALAIGYQDVFSVGKIAINQAGRAVPVFAMVMVSYLLLSLIVSAVLNVYNKRIQFVSK
jgi:general L-amino acid transport system permease protein